MEINARKDLDINILAAILEIQMIKIAKNLSRVYEIFKSIGVKAWL